MKTDTELKSALAKMLPEEINFLDGQLYYKEGNVNGNEVLDTELLHVCWLVEETLAPLGQLNDYIEHLAATKHSVYRDSALCFATWQQRATALCKVKGIEV